MSSNTDSVFEKFTSPVICLPQKDIDTDQIIPAEFLKTTSRENLGKNVFANLKKVDSDFPVLNGRILVAGKNFGCGSSREHAAWALKQAGIDVVISSEFADIFCGNAEKNGLLPIVLPETVVQNFLVSGGDLTVDLAHSFVVDASGARFAFEISDFSKKRLLENLSDLDYLQKFSQKIDTFDREQKAVGL